MKCGEIYLWKNREYEDKYQASKKAYDALLKRIKDEKKNEDEGEEMKSILLKPSIVVSAKIAKKKNRNKKSKYK